MSAPRAVPLEFDEFVLDEAQYSLRRRETTIALQPKTFALLAYFCAHPGRLIRKDELLRELWPGVIVTDNSLTRCVKDLRKALGDDVQIPRYIETVPRMGYRFLVEPRPLAPAAPTPLADEAVAAEPGAELQPQVRDEAAPRRTPARRGMALLALAGLAIALALASWQVGRDRAVSRTATATADSALDASRRGSGTAAGSNDFDAEMNFQVGRDLLERRRHGWREQALAAFERAIAIDPTHAASHAGKALAHAVSARPGEGQEAQPLDSGARRGTGRAPARCHGRDRRALVGATEVATNRGAVREPSSIAA